MKTRIPVAWPFTATRPSLTVILLLACWTVFCTNLFFSSSQQAEYVDAVRPPCLSCQSREQDVSFSNASHTTLAEDSSFAVPSIQTHMSPAAKPASSKPPSVDPKSTTAILPVSNASMPYLQERLAALLDVSLHLHELVLLCHRDVRAKVKEAVLHTLSNDILDSYMDISFSVWPEDLEEAAATLLAARHLGSSVGRILLLDYTGLDLINSEVREMLIGPFSTPLPVGPKGYEDSNNGFKCVTANEEPKAAAFLVPPFSIAPLLVPPHDLASDPEYGIWVSLGKHISRARYEGVGGVAVDTSRIGSAWCPLTSPQSEVNSETSSLVPGTYGNTSSLAGHEGQFAIILSLMRDLVAFTSVVCHLQSEGHELHILITGENTKPGVRNVTQPITLGPSCMVEIAFLSDLHALDQSTTVQSWLHEVHTVGGIVISSPEAAISSPILDDDKDSTFIQIPREDLSYCDWMGNLALEAWRNWHKPQLDVSVITNNRPESLSRLLSSLSTASYFGDKVDLRINVEQTADANTLHVVNDYRWPHGATFIHRRVIHGGLLPAVVESWYPHSNDSYGLMLEDDVELSPLFYAWIKLSLLQYRYGKAEELSPQLFGISLYQQKNLELRPEGRHQFSARTLFSSASFANPNTPYLSQIPCSWGAVYFPEHWREFHDYLSVRLSETHPDLPIDKIVAPGLRSNKWTRSWKKYFIELVYLRGYLMLYPNFRDYVSLSTNHLEVGSHVRAKSPEAYERKKKLYILPLMERPASPSDELRVAANPDETFGRVPGATDLMDLPEGRMPSWEKLPVLDLLGLLATEQVLQERGTRRREELFHCELPNHPSDVRGLLCLGADVVEFDGLD